MGRENVDRDGLIAELELLRQRVSELEEAAVLQLGDISVASCEVALLDRLKLGVLILDQLPTTMYVNAALVEMLGYSRQELVENKFTSLIHRDDLAGCQELLETLQEVKDEHQEIRLLKRDGSWLYVMLTASPIFDGAGERVGLVLGVRDITERKRVREELLREREFEKSLVETAQAIILMLDPEGRIVRFNPFMEEISGYRLEEVAGKDWFTTFLPEREHKRIGDVFDEALQDVKTRGTINPIIIKDGRERMIEWSNTRLFDPEGEIIGVLAVGKDITEHFEADQALKEYSERLEQMVEERTRDLGEVQERLLRQQKLAALGQMAGGVAHELRNPLSVISNAVYYLKSNLMRADEKVGEYLNIIDTELYHSEKIISDLLEFSSVKEPNRKAVSADDIIQNVFGKNPTPREITISINLPEDLPKLYVDPQQIEQVFGNLFTNAYQAMMPDIMQSRGEEGVLTIEGREDEGDVLLSVRDNGCGIPEASMERIFLPLFTTKPQGIGLGLVISKNLIEANGGRIEVESVQDEGSAFTVVLPTSPQGEG
jgi:PAS domain S-box-containing protein